MSKEKGTLPGRVPFDEKNVLQADKNHFMLRLASKASLIIRENEF